MGRSTFPFCTTSETNWLQICGDPSDFCNIQWICSQPGGAEKKKREFLKKKKKKKKKNNEKTKQMQRNQDGSKH